MTTSALPPETSTQLEWHDTDEGRCWFADSRHKFQEEGEPDKDLIWQIDLSNNGDSTWIVVETSSELVADIDGYLPEFDDSDAAKAWCQQRENRLLGRDDSELGEPDPDPRSGETIANPVTTADEAGLLGEKPAENITGNITNPAEPPPAKEKSEGIELPACLLRVVGVAAKEEGRYSMTGVLVDVDAANGIVRTISTDGRCMIVAKSNRGVFDDDVSIIVPGNIARNAARIASIRGTRDERAVVTILKGKKKHWKLTAYTGDGTVDFDWTDNPDLKFPPYADIIPDYTESAGVGRIGITPDLVASVLTALQKVVGKEPLVRVFLPPNPDRPLKLESQDGDNIHAIAVIMPAAIEEWAAEKPKPEEKPVADIPGQQTIPMADEAWRAKLLVEITGMPSRALKAFANRTPPFETLGQIADFTAAKSHEHGGNNELKDIKGMGPEMAGKVEEAMMGFWRANLNAGKPVAANPSTEALETQGAANASILGGDSGGTDSTVSTAIPDPSAQPPQDDITDASTVEAVAEVPDLLTIRVARRQAGPWCFTATASVNGFEGGPAGDGKSERGWPWTGHYPTRAEAAIAGADAVDEWLPAAKSLNKKQRANRSAIRVELDAFDKRMGSF